MGGAGGGHCPRIRMRSEPDRATGACGLSQTALPRHAVWARRRYRGRCRPWSEGPAGPMTRLGLPKLVIDRTRVLQMSMGNRVKGFASRDRARKGLRLTRSGRSGWEEAFGRFFDIDAHRATLQAAPCSSTSDTMQQHLRHPAALPLTPCSSTADTMQQHR